jgi:Protein of unknown function (DUF3040)
MRLSLRERRNLRRINRTLRGADPRLASMLDMFSRLAAGDAMPSHEQLRAADGHAQVPSTQRHSREPR